MTELPRLDAFEGKRDALQRVGRATLELVTLPSDSGAVTPRRWVIEGRVFEEHAARVLPKNLELRALLKQARSRGGEERCARAFELVSTAEVPGELLGALEGLCRATTSGRSFVLRPFVVAGERGPGGRVRLEAKLAAANGAELGLAVRHIWASIVTSRAIDALASAAVKSVGVAIVIEEAEAFAARAWLVRAADAGGGSRLGVAVLRESAPMRAQPRPVVPLGPLFGVGPLPPEVERLRAELGSGGALLLERVFDAATGGLGEGARVLFGVGDHSSGTPRVVVLAVEHEAPKGAEGSLRAWSEVRLVGEAHSQTCLGVDECERLARRGLASMAAALGHTSSSAWPVTSVVESRLYLGLTELARTADRIPMVGPRDVLAALGTGDRAVLERLVAHADAKGPSRWRETLAAVSALRKQVGLDRESSDSLTQLGRDARVLGELDYSLLPNDAMASTLLTARRLLEDSVELASRLLASMLGYELAVHELIARRVAGVAELVGARLVAGVKGTYGASLALAFARVVDVCATDSAAMARLEASPIARASELPDGPARGALGQFLSLYGDMGVGGLEPSVPRWSEDARDVGRMLRLWLARGGEAGAHRRFVEEKQDRARATADAELARFEPELAWAERATLRWLVERARTVARARAGVDRLVWRALAIFRQVVLDVDRRLVRIDPRLARGAVFHVSLDTLAQGLKSGRPELGRLVAMREGERRGDIAHARFVFTEGNEYGPTLSVHAREHAGIGASAGVMDGLVCHAGDGFPATLGADGVLVVPALDVALSPLYALAGAVVSESSGVLHPASEMLRELAIPCVTSVCGAGAAFDAGEAVRVDGERGIVARAAREERG